MSRKKQISGRIAGTNLLLLGLLLATAATPFLSADAAEPVRVGGEVRPPVKISGPSPDYPIQARRARMTGTVVLEATIDERGEVVAVEAVESLPMGLTQAALSAARRWRFEPATRNGQPVAVVHTLRISFQAEGREPERRDFKIIANAGVSTSALTAKEVSDIFLKKTTAWESGLKITPVNLSVGHPAREAFSKEIHGKGAVPIERRWDRIIFSGMGVPPVKLETDREVVEFVGRNAGGVGYVAAGTALPAGVKELEIGS